MIEPLDDFDRRILTLVQRNNKMPLREIGERVHMSAASVQRRIARMEREGVIAANVAVVDPASLDREVTVVVEVEVENERSDLLGKVRDLLAAAPEVQQCYYVTGDTDFVLVVTAKSVAEYNAFMNRMQLECANIKRYRSLIVMDRVKVGLDVPTS